MKELYRMAADGLPAFRSVELLCKPFLLQRKSQKTNFWMGRLIALSVLLGYKLDTFNVVCETYDCSILLRVNCYSIEYFIINVIYGGYSTIRWSDVGGNIRRVLQHIVCCIVISMSQHQTCLCHVKQWEQLYNDHLVKDIITYGCSS